MTVMTVTMTDPSASAVGEPSSLRMTGRATTLRGTLSSLTSLRLAMIAMIMALPFLLRVTLRRAACRQRVDRLPCRCGSS